MISIRDHRMLAFLATLSVSLTVLACGNSPPKETQKPAAASSPAGDNAATTTAAIPEDVLATVLLKNPAEQLRSLFAFVDAVQPGASADLDAGQILTDITSDWGSLPARGFDLEKPMYFLFVDWEEASTPLVLVAAIADRKAIEAELSEDSKMRVKRGYAVIGEPQLVDNVADYAFTGLRNQPLPPDPSLIVRVDTIMQRYGEEFADGMESLSSMSASAPESRRLMEGYAAAMTALAHQTQTARVALATSDTELSVLFDLDAKPNTQMAQFARSQRPSQFQLTREVVSTNDIFQLGGQLDYSLVQEQLGQLWEWSLSLAPDQDGSDMPAEVEAFAKRWIELFQGEFALSGGFDQQGLMAIKMRSFVPDTQAAQTLIKDWYAAVKKYPAAFKYRDPKTSTETHGNVDIHVLRAGLVVRPEEAAAVESIYGTEMVTAMAISGQRLTGAIGQSAAPSVRSMLDRTEAQIRAQAEPAAVADARSRKESGFMGFDLAAVIAHLNGSPAASASGLPSMVMGLGFEADTTRIRITVPASQVAMLVAIPGMP